MRPEVGIILLNKGVTHQEKKELEAALEIFAEAAQVIDGKRQPRLRFALRYNQAASACRLGRAEEADSAVKEVQQLAEWLRNDVDLIKVAWLRGNVDVGMGRRQEGQEILEQVRRDFASRSHPYDYAQASLDVALLYREEGRFAEIQSLAQEMLNIFVAQGVHREAVTAVILFQEAAKSEQISADFLRRLQDYLSKARNDAKLQFKR